MPTLDLAIYGQGIGDFLNGSTYPRDLVDRHFNIIIDPDKPEDGDLIIYYTNYRDIYSRVHYGIYRDDGDDGMAESKWDSYPVIF